MINTISATDLPARLGRLSRRMDDVARMTWTLTSRRTREQILAGLLDLAVRAVRADVGCVLHLEEGRLCTDASMGLDGEMAESMKVNGQSVAQHVLTQKQPLQIPLQWASKDPQRTLNVRHLLAVPIVADSGSDGVLLLAHGREGNSFTEEDQDAAEILSALASTSLQNANWLNDTVERQRVDLQAESGRLVDITLLPRPGQGPSWLEWESFHRPASQVGGDFFDIVVLDGGSAVVAVADFSEVGITAALRVSGLRTLLRSECLRGHSPAQILEWVNRCQFQNLQAPVEHAFSLCLAMLDKERRRITYANAGHATPYLWDALRMLPVPLEQTGPLLGLRSDSPYTEVTLPMGPGFRCFFYSDGLTEAGDPRGESFGGARTQAAVLEACGHQGTAFMAAMKHRLSAFTGCAEPHDDLTLLWLGERGGPAGG